MQIATGILAEAEQAAAAIALLAILVVAALIISNGALIHLHQHRAQTHAAAAPAKNARLRAEARLALIRQLADIMSAQFRHLQSVLSLRIPSLATRAQQRLTASR